MIWIQIQFSPFSRLLKITQALRISKVKILIRHFFIFYLFIYLFFFFFENTFTDVVMKVINNLNVAKSCQMHNIPTKAIKMDQL